MNKKLVIVISLVLVFCIGLGIIFATTYSPPPTKPQYKDYGNGRLPNGIENHPFVYDAVSFDHHDNYERFVFEHTDNEQVISLREESYDFNPFEDESWSKNFRTCISFDKDGFGENYEGYNADFTLFVLKGETFYLKGRDTIDSIYYEYDSKYGKTGFKCSYYIYIFIDNTQLDGYFEWGSTQHKLVERPDLVEVTDEQLGTDYFPYHMRFILMQNGSSPQVATNDENALPVMTTYTQADKFIKDMIWFDVASFFAVDKAPLPEGSFMVGIRPVVECKSQRDYDLSKKAYTYQLNNRIFVNYVWAFERKDFEE